MRIIRTLSLIVLLAVLGRRAVLPSAGSPTANITVNNADALQHHGFSSSTALNGSLSSVVSRVSIAFSQAVKQITLPELPTTLSSNVTSVEARPAVGYSQAMQREQLVAPAIMNTLAGLEKRLTLTFAQAVLRTTLAYPTDVIADATPPQHPTSPSATPQGLNVTINWTTNEFTTALVEYGLSPGSYTASVEVSQFKRGHSVTLTGLQERTYYYRIRSTDQSGNSTTTSESSFVIKGDVTAPTLSNLTVTEVSTQSVRVQWTTNELATSIVEYGTNPNSYASSQTDGALVTSHSVTLTGLTPNVTYYLRAGSRDSANNLRYSGQQQFLLKDLKEVYIPIVIR